MRLMISWLDKGRIVYTDNSAPLVKELLAKKTPFCVATGRIYPWKEKAMLGNMQKCKCVLIEEEERCNGRENQMLL